METTATKSITRNNRTIALNYFQETYNATVNDKAAFRKHLDEMIALYPELFPDDIADGYTLKEMRYSKKQNVWIRRIDVNNVSYTIRPSFMMPYMTGKTDEIEKALFLRKFDVPFWALSYVFGKDHMYWYRIEQSLGRNSIVGTTVRNPDDIPRNLGADEKHSWILGNKVYVATTVGNQCILGASISTDAGDAALQKAYGVFKYETQCIKPAYTPDTVNIDGWKATRNAWLSLFASVVIICCFLHVFIKIRDRAKKKYHDIFTIVSSKLWDCYHADRKSQFSQRTRRLHEWCKKNKVPDVILNPIAKLRKHIADYSIAYDHPDAHRTSNMLDRLMQRMDRHLFSTQYFHGSLSAAELSIRGWALIQNFAPSNPQTILKHQNFQSPAERLNKFRYHENWLHNLMISASLGGYKTIPPNPL